MALFVVVHGSMAGPAAYARLAKELDRCGQRVLLEGLPVDRPELIGTDYAGMVASSWTPTWPKAASDTSRW